MLIWGLYVNGNNQLLQWKLNPTDPRDIKINFNNTVDGKVMKTIEGKNCYCKTYKEIWADKQQHQEHIVIICQNLNIAGAQFENAWA